MRENYAFCEALVREADKDRYLASLFVPAAARPHVFALYAFNVEIARVRELAREPLAGEVRLQWWRDALAGNGQGDVAGNPVAAALADTIERYELSRAPLLALIDAREFDLYDQPMATLAGLEAYARATTSALFALAAQLSAGEAAAAEAAEPAGLGYALTGLLRAFPLHAARGQLYLPFDVLARHGASRDDILAGRATPELSRAFAELRDHARRHLIELRACLASVPRAALPAFLPAALIEAYLAPMQRAGYDPFKTVEVAQWRRQWILWRAARRAPPAS
jgi:phytoene synthase